MPNDQLKADLDRLRQEIDALDGDNRDAQQRLQALADRIQHELDDQPQVADPAGLIEELEDAVSRFEASHPTLGAILNNLVVVLGSMGV